MRKNFKIMLLSLGVFLIIGSAFTQRDTAKVPTSAHWYSGSPGFQDYTGRQQTIEDEMQFLEGEDQDNLYNFYDAPGQGRDLYEKGFNTANPSGTLVGNIYRKLN